MSVTTYLCLVWYHFDICFCFTCEINVYMFTLTHKYKCKWTKKRTTFANSFNIERTKTETVRKRDTANLKIYTFEYHTIIIMAKKKQNLHERVIVLDKWLWNREMMKRKTERNSGCHISQAIERLMVVDMRC